MKKFLLTLLTVALAVCSVVFVGAACSDNTESGKDGQTPFIGTNGNWWIGTTDTGVPAKGKDGSDGKDGENGMDGVDGQTPFIGTNGNWWIGSTDTGIPAKGKDGSDGKNGENGKDGKSAYELYKEIYGYTGTEEEWLYDLVNGKLSIKETYTVTFDSDGGTPVENQQVAEGKKAKEPDITVKTGYAFAGWFVKTTEWNFLAYTVTENVTLKAKWIANKYKISFDTAGGKTLPDMEVTYNEAYTLPIPEKEDYVFIGWKENETDFSPSEIWNRTSGAKLTAKWVIAKSTITFDSDGAGEVPPMTINYKENYTLPVIKKDGYAFAGWFLNSVRFIDGTVLTGDITLIAKWERVTDSFKYSETNEEITITEFIGSATDVIVPGAINGKPVTAIGEDVFKNNTGITSVTFDGAFNNYTEKMFEGCSSIKKLTISGVYNKALYYLFGDNINDVPDSLTEISFAKNSAYYSGAMFRKPVANHAVTYVVPEGTTSIPDNMFNECGGLKTVTIPDSVTSIGNNAFYNCQNLTNIAIPNSVTSIGDMAFTQCFSLKSVTIGNSVTSIGSFAFQSCIKLASINIPDSVTSIGIAAFSNCRTLIKEESGIEYVDTWIVDTVNSTILAANIKNGTRGIADRAFDNCTNLKDLIIPDSVTSIGGSAFWECSKLTTVNYTGTVDQWAEIYFDNTLANPLYYAKNLYINNELVTEVVLTTATKISSYAFYNCGSITSITIPDKVTSIGNSVFCGCSSLTDITIPNSVTSIGYYAFASCSKLKTINYKGDEKQWNSISKDENWNNGAGNYTINYNYKEEN